MIQPSSPEQELSPDDVSVVDGIQEPVTSSRFSELHSKTFEMELLVSGALVFAFTRFPPYIDRGFQVLATTTAGNFRLLGTYGIVYTAMMVYTLILFFVLHLGLRAYWIGLVGLESVFPGGIRWETTPLGPNAKQLYQRKLHSLPRQIERLDDWCSLTFSFAFLIVCSCLYSIFVVVLAGILSFTITWLFDVQANAAVIFFATMGLIVFPQAAATLFDRYLGKKLRPDGWSQRITRWFLSVSYNLSPMPLIGYIQLTLQSRFKSQRTTAAIMVTILSLTLAIVLAMLVRSGDLKFNSLERFPDDLNAYGIEPSDHRDSARKEIQDIRQPSIQSDVIEDPFIKLLIPYYPYRHNSLASTACPKVEPLESLFARLAQQSKGSPEERLSVRQNLGCFSSLFTVTLDGVELEGLDWLPVRSHKTGVSSLTTYIDARELARGRHDLVVTQPSSRSQLAPDQSDPPFEFLADDTFRIQRIPFWR